LLIPCVANGICHQL